MATGTATNRTNITLPPDVSNEILQKTQEASAVMSLARQIELPGRGTSINVITGDPEAAWVGETAAKPVSDPGVTTKVMSAYKLAVIVPFSKEFRRDVPALYDALVQRLPNALGNKFDATVFTGSAPGSNFDVLSGCTAQAIGTNTYAGLVAAEADIAAHGGDMNGIALSPVGKGVLLAATDDNKRPLFINTVAEGAIPYVLGAPVRISKGAYKAGAATTGTTPAVPNIVGAAGDWTQAMYGTVNGVEISFSEDAVILDSSNNPIYLFQQNMFAVRAEIEVGFRADTDCFNLLTTAVA
ncbi:MAG: phage major capsid protein [Lachnospiraceae bacterium]|nr:phage major capsid protein [Lachnospiraceae bacterium]